MKKFNTIVYIGRFQPFHNGHLKVIERALELADEVLILVGSTNIARNIKNPFTYGERAAMIASCTDNIRVKIRPLEDDLYNENIWLQSVQNMTDDLTGKVGLIGHHKDSSSYYLDSFPQWEQIEVPSFDGISSTDIRENWYSGHEYASGKLPTPVHVKMYEFSQWEAFDQLQKEWRFIKEYKRRWENSPYPPTFVTVDAVMVHSGHILLVKRGAEPGKGLWALPGGFVDQKETLEQSVIRELREETKLKLPEKVIKGSQVGFKVFDHPDRSLRGRTITNAFYYNIPTGELPKVKGGDDAAHAEWIPIGNLKNMEREFFEDHLFIINSFLK